MSLNNFFFKIPVIAVLLFFCFSCVEQRRYSDYDESRYYEDDRRKRNDLRRTPSRYEYDNINPNSRAYSNPYDFPPKDSYPYYDGDAYYVAPTGGGYYQYDDSNSYDGFR